jgi:hypothetical protein
MNVAASQAAATRLGDSPPGLREPTAYGSGGRKPPAAVALRACRGLVDIPLGREEVHAPCELPRLVTSFIGLASIESRLKACIVSCPDHEDSFHSHFFNSAPDPSPNGLCYAVRVLQARLAPIVSTSNPSSMRDIPFPYSDPNGSNRHFDLRRRRRVGRMDHDDKNRRQSERKRSSRPKSCPRRSDVMIDVCTQIDLRSRWKFLEGPLDLSV